MMKGGSSQCGKCRVELKKGKNLGRQGEASETAGAEGSDG